MPTEAENEGRRLRLVRTGQASRADAHDEATSRVGTLQEQQKRELQVKRDEIEAVLRTEYSPVAIEDEYQLRRADFERSWSDHVGTLQAERSKLLTELVAVREQIKALRPRRSRGKKKGNTKPLSQAASYFGGKLR